MIGEFDEKTQSAFNSYYFDNYSKEGYGGERSVLNIENFLLVLKQAKIIIPDRKKFRILELGCADGRTVKELRDLGFDAYGIEISQHMLKKVEPEIKKYIYFMDIRNLEIFKDDSFDLVYSNSLMYLNPEELDNHLDELHRISKYIFAHILCKEDAFVKYLEKEDSEKLYSYISNYKEFPEMEFLFATHGWEYETHIMPEGWSGWNLFCKNSYGKGMSRLKTYLASSGISEFTVFARDSLQKRKKSGIETSRNITAGLCMNRALQFCRYQYQFFILDQGFHPLVTDPNQITEGAKEYLKNLDITSIYGIPEKFVDIFTECGYRIINEMKDPLFSISKILEASGNKYQEIRTARKLYEDVNPPTHSTKHINQLNFRSFFRDNEKGYLELQDFVKRQIIEISKKPDFTIFSLRILSNVYLTYKKILEDLYHEINCPDTYNLHESCIFDTSCVNGEITTDSDKIIGFWLTAQMNSDTALQIFRLADRYYTYLADYLVYRSAWGQLRDVEYMNDIGLLEEEQQNLNIFKERYKEKEVICFKAVKI